MSENVSYLLNQVQWLQNLHQKFKGLQNLDECQVSVNTILQGKASVRGLKPSYGGPQGLNLSMLTGQVGPWGLPSPVCYKIGE